MRSVVDASRRYMPSISVIRPSVGCESDGDIRDFGESDGHVRAGRRDALARMVFRAPSGERYGHADRLSFVVTSGGAPFCLVARVTIRGQLWGTTENGQEGTCGAR